MREQHRQPSLLHTDKLAILILLGQCIEVDDARHCGGHEPRQTQHSVDEVEDSVQHEIVVVCLTVLQLVVLVVDEMPRDTVVQVAQ